VRLLRDRWDILLVIAAGGALGSLGRWGLGEALARPRGEFPVATFTENLAGAFLLGLLMVWLTEVWPSARYLRPFLAVGVLGGFTTFSTYMLDTRDLLAAGRPALAAAYLVGTMLVGLLAVFAGVLSGRSSLALARRLPRRGR
jgi:CrcB protein